MKSVISLIKSFYSNKKLIRAVVYSILVISVIITLIPTYIREVKPNLHNIYLFQAEAFLHGRLSVGDADELDSYELSLFNGKKYVALPPFPAVVLMPFVAIWNIEKIHVSLIGVALALFSLLILKKILKQLQITKEKVPWILCAFMLGSAYWWCFCRSGAPWLTAQVIAVTCILLAIHEALGKGRGFLIGTYLGMAILSRQLSVYYLFFFCFVIWNGCVNKRIEINRKKILNIVFLFIGTGIWISLYLAFNWARFGNPFDTGYAYISHTYHLNARIIQYGLFNIAYIPFNFTYMFLQGFHIVFGGKDMLTIQWPDTFGTSITFASPFVFYAFRARWTRLPHIGAWLTITFCLVHMMLYYNNGWHQQNCQRFTMDFMPVLIVLVALGINRAKSNLWKYAIAYSVILNIIAYIVVPGFRNIREFLS